MAVYTALAQLFTFDSNSTKTTVLLIAAVLTVVALAGGGLATAHVSGAVSSAFVAATGSIAAGISFGMADAASANRGYSITVIVSIAVVAAAIVARWFEWSGWKPVPFWRWFAVLTIMAFAAAGYGFEYARGAGWETLIAVAMLGLVVTLAAGLLLIKGQRDMSKQIPNSPS